MELGHNVQTEQVYAPVENMTGQGTGYMMREFIRRAVFSDGTGEYRIPSEPDAGDTVRIRLRTARGNVFAAAAPYRGKSIKRGMAALTARPSSHTPHPGRCPGL